jgi:plastocyanin
LKTLRHVFLFASVMFLAGFVFLSCSNDNGSNNGNPMAPGGSGADVTITILGNNGTNSYSPNPDTVSVGQTVSWKNNDSMIHTATANGNLFHTGNISPTATSTPIRMDSTGSFPYHCAITGHNMTGTLVVK